MDVFDIIGPVMIGPSSSHTAGAVRIGKIARALLGEEPIKALIKLHGSFAKTYKGHGTDKALIGGIMGINVDDIRIRDSLKLAKKAGLEFSFEPADLGQVHPNTVYIEIQGATGKKSNVIGCSIGGGNIKIIQVNGIDVEFTGQYHTLVICHKDILGAIATVTNVLAAVNINIAFMRDYRTLKGGLAIMVLETDQPIDDEVSVILKRLSGVMSATIVKPISWE
jgi:L-serine dehydratase